MTQNSGEPDYYQMLGLPPQATLYAIRQAHRDLSKDYHPDTTRMPLEQAKEKFRQIQEAYRVLSDPAQRLRYDQLRGYSRLTQRSSQLKKPMVPDREPVQLSSSAYLEPGERPLSGGELFALFLLGLTLVGCLALAVGLAIARGEPLSSLPPSISSLGITGIDSLKH